MTLIVKGNAKFRAATVKALQTICPCFFYTLADDGTVLLQSHQNHDIFCKCYCVHLAGCNLMDDLTSDAKKVTIRETSGRSIYSPRKRRVRWNPGATPDVGTTKGKQPAPAEIVLGHELIHAHHHNSGTLAEGWTNGIKNEEINTVRGENQLRAERQPPALQRTHYGRNKVPKPGAGDLDTTDRNGCKCSARRDLPKVTSKDTKVTPNQLTDRLHAMIGRDISGVSAELNSALALRTDITETTAFGQILENTMLAKRAIVFESIDVAHDAHSFFALTSDGETATLTTNTLVKRHETLWTMHLLAGTKSNTAPLSEDGTKLLDTIMAADLTGTVGGDEDVLDATLDILTVIDGDTLRTAALYGAEWTQIDADAEPPETRADSEMWEVMEAARQLLFAHLDDQ